MHDIVFLPNLAGYRGEAKARINDFLDCCREGRSEDWTCKKTAREGDLYLFWFAKPASRIAGVGVCSSDVKEQENDGADWTNFPKVWACAFEPLSELKHPITLDHIKGDQALAIWWKSQPFRGRPKSIPNQVISRLLTLIIRFNPALRIMLQRYSSGTEPYSSVGVPDDDDAPPDTVRYTSIRTVRNTAKGERLKLLYKCKCQICGHRIRVPGARRGWYVEVHHMRPLGGKHRGHDNWNNMLVLCPNCHVEFDACAMALDPKTRQIFCYDCQNPNAGKTIKFRHGHALAPENIEYHWRRSPVRDGMGSGTVTGASD